MESASDKGPIRPKDERVASSHGMQPIYKAGSGASRNLAILRFRTRRNACIPWKHLLTVMMRPRSLGMASPMMLSGRGLLACAVLALVWTLGAKCSPASQLQHAASAMNAGAAETQKHRLSQELQITGDQTWLDTGIDVQPGEHVVVSASGNLRYPDAKQQNGPEGPPRGFRDLLRILPLNAAGRGALLGRIGEKDAAQPFLIGIKREVVAPIAGRLWIGINQGSDDSGDGTYTVRVDVDAPAAGAAAMTVLKKVNTLPGIDSALFTKIPRRVGDQAGNLGDMVNFLILGSQQAMEKVFTTAGWVKVDADFRGTVLHGLIESLSKESYLTMPMSPLYLFGRMQDYGWAHADPLTVVASRNHLRIWRAPFQVNGQTMWVGAATHDIGFERDQRNNGVTHKIHPDIDLERDYIEKTLISTGLVAEVTHFLPQNPTREAKTATGATFRSNGQVLIMKLAESASISTTAATQ